MALLILVLASGALVVRAIYLRRRFRNQVQAAIDAGLLNPNKLPVPQTKPEMHEVYVRSLPNDAVQWENFLVSRSVHSCNPSHQNQIAYFRDYFGRADFAIFRQRVEAIPVIFPTFSIDTPPTINKCFATLAYI